MLRAICASSRMCKISMENILSSSQTCTPKLAASPLAPEFSRSYSIVSLSGWTQSPALGHLSVLTRPCCQQNIFALQGFQTRDMTKLAPKFKGGKLKPYSSYKERFKTTATGLILYKRPGHRHKRFNKGPHRNRQLRRTQVLTNAYTATMQRLGFVSRRF